MQQSITLDTCVQKLLSYNLLNGLSFQAAVELTIALCGRDNIPEQLDAAAQLAQVTSLGNSTRIGRSVLQLS